MGSAYSFDSCFNTYPPCCIQLIGLVDWVFANGPGDLGSIPGRVIPKTLKWYLIPPCLTLSNMRYVSRVKWSNPGKGVASSPTPRCSSYWKGSLLVTLDYGRQLSYSCCIPWSALLHIHHAASHGYHCYMLVQLVLDSEFSKELLNSFIVICFVFLLFCARESLLHILREGS